MYHQIKQTTLALSLCLSTTVVFAQQTVKGTVKDANGDPMIGVSIFVDGNTAAISDLDGHFSLSSVKPQSKVKVSYVGYMDQTVTVGNNKRIEIVMQEDNQTLNDVVVIGYGSMKKGDLTGSVSSVNSEQVQSRGVTSVSEALPGVGAWREHYTERQPAWRQCEHADTRSVVYQYPGITTVCHRRRGLLVYGFPQP